MAVLTREEFFEALQNRIGEDSSDDAIAYIENMTDTYNDLESKATGDGVDWEQRYKELDESWKEKYRHRFFSGPVVQVPAQMFPSGQEPEQQKLTIDDLFS